MDEINWTEKKWKLCVNPQQMLHYLKSPRKARLFVCACLRRAWHVAKNKQVQSLLPLVEDAADEKLAIRDRERALELARTLARARISTAQHCIAIECEGPFGKVYYTGGVFDTSAAGLLGEFAACAVAYGTPKVPFAEAKKAERKKQAPLLRELLGNPFRDVTFNKKWRTDTVRALAQRAYDVHEFGTLPILADALQDAGCDSEDLLNHLRDTSATHYRGCWALDLVLGNVVR